ncbi:DUF2461 domain-containing protein [Janibacter alkaliphilus]|uniref:Uncharacterized protein (TIGR02453 family) n=1 Tax=Janibacter alkaliphilus TaxID=1069963 RepID=A0A852XE63_9MICO|nr:DUF2461 domain-containing protein [Janibacter alkaliphilus]NYG36751.1 uncharacterized protein (TIGR02453 family) [Janibacter alkaliphilus]
MPAPFTGIPHAATDFYAGLELDNTKAYWDAHREAYQRDVREPMTALLAELDDYGEAKLFRPNRDVRFSADKSPYKTHQGGYIPAADATGWYVEVSADGFKIGGGCYRLDPPRLTALRAAIDAPSTGQELQRVTDRLREQGWSIDGDQVKTTPRGWSVDHPRIELLRHKTLSASVWIDDGDIVTTERLVGEVRERFEQVRPLVEIIAATAR